MALTSSAVQPVDVRGGGADALSTYMNHYVCNGAVIAPQFGDTAADDAAKADPSELLPDWEVVMLDIEALAAGWWHPLRNTAAAQRAVRRDRRKSDRRRASLASLPRSRAG